MKFYQDSGFKWTVASTFVLASIFAMTSFGASAGAPIANPPGGNISPTFTNLTTATDVIVGKNLRVGDSIVPNIGKSFALAADKVNFTKDIEAKGTVLGNYLQSVLDITSGKDIIAGKDIKVTGVIKPNNGTDLELQADNVLTSNNLHVKGVTTFDNNIFLNGKTLSLDGGSNILLSGPIAADGNAVFNGTVEMNSSVVANKTFDVEGNSFFKKIAEFTSGIINYGTLSVSGTTFLKGNTNAEKNLIVSGNASVVGHLKAASIGDFVFGSDKPKSVAVKGTTRTTKFCPDKNYQMLSCTLRYFPDPMPTPDVYNGKAHIDSVFIDRLSDPNGISYCDASVWNQYAVPILYQIQTTCFNPNK